MLTLLAVGLFTTLPLFAGVWALCVRVKNYGYLDVVWSLSIGLLACLYGLWGSGAPERRVLFTAVAVAWSLRLGVYVLIRVTRAHPHEDPRYRTLRERWPGRGRFLAFFELQALVAVIFSLPFLIASVNNREALSATEYLGLSLACAAIAGEWCADWQAQRFKRNSANQSAVVDAGLWRYSRHPNYFFEWLVWWGFFISALGSPWGIVSVVCPLLMLYFLLRVTGIPLTEKHSLESRGDAYRRYQQETSRFVPWFPQRR
jgi:steroid 5-alpha reductase family enzyme